ncbi:Epithelial chloride channel proteinlike, partial [Caligus rogercresseyi]
MRPQFLHLHFTDKPHGLQIGMDVYPPNRVIDLHVTEVADASLNVELKWTAPGGDYDKGKGT